MSHVTVIANWCVSSLNFASNEMTPSAIFLFALLAAPVAGLRAVAGRRSVVLGCTTCVLTRMLPVERAHASYAMTQAAQEQQTWTPTDKAKERAVYESIEEELDRKRRFRPEVSLCVLSLSYCLGARPTCHTCIVYRLESWATSEVSTRSGRLLAVTSTRK